jgi:hypothetical protein
MQILRFFFIDILYVVCNIKVFSIKQVELLRHSFPLNHVPWLKILKKGIFFLMSNCF